MNQEIVRENNLLHQMVIVDGLPGCGKTMLSPIIASLKRIELLSYSPEIENLCFLYRLKKIDLDAAIAMIKIQADLMIYETMMSRNTNFRPTDLSSAFRNQNPLKYLHRLFTKGDEDVPQLIKKKKPILNLATHNLLAYSSPLIKALNEKLTFIEVVRHPLYMIKQQSLNMERILGTARNFTIYYKNKDKQLPYYAEGYEESFMKGNPVEKAIYSIKSLTEKINSTKKNLSEEENKKIITIPFENFVLKPFPYLDKINNLLETNFSKKTEKELKRQNVPRDLVASGIDLKIYKRCGWEPPKSNSEKEELKIRYEYFRQNCDNSAMDTLDQLILDYEENYWKPEN